SSFGSEALVLLEALASSIALQASFVLLEKWPNEGQDLFDVRRPERTAFAWFGRRGQIADLKQVAIFPDPGTFVVGPNFLRIAPGVNRNQPTADRGRYMHRAAVDANREPGPTNEMNQLQNRGVIHQINAIVRNWNLAPGPAHQDHPMRG